MPSATGTNGNAIPLRSKASRRFYEPILLEVALMRIRPNQDFSASQHEPNTMRDNVDNAEQIFKCFANRFAQVCDNRRGENGGTVTGIAVLEEPEGVHYIIGSNNRRVSKLQSVEQFATQLLNIVARSIGRSAASDSPVYREGLWHILKFDETRLRYYLAKTIEYLDDCIEDFDRRHDEEPLASEAVKFKRQLTELMEFVIVPKDEQLEKSQYFTACEQLFLFIQNAQQEKFGDFISMEAREGQMNVSKKWMELRHFVGRLHSYYLAIETIIRASRLWGRLCHDFKVTVIPSATVLPHPLKQSRPNAKEIVGRMFPTEELKVQYRALADGLQDFGLDEELFRGCNNSSPTHMVHAEVLVLGFILDYLRDNTDAAFWKDWKYIGSSKPTCRLCSYYFEKHPSGVRVRESHNNLYPHWRTPDVFDEKGMKETEKILNAMNEKTRLDAKRSLETQIPRGRVHDSNSFSEQPSARSYITDASVSELVSVMTNLAIPDTINEEDTRSTTGELGDQYQAEEDDDEEEGGVVVFRGRRSLSSQS